MMQSSLTKINWLIKVGKIYDNIPSKIIGPKYISDLIKSAAYNTDQEILAHPKEQTFSMQEVIDQIQRCELSHISYDDFFQIMGNLKKQEDQLVQDNSFQRDQKEAANTWTNCSMNTSHLSHNNEVVDQDEIKSPSELFININIYQKNEMIGKRINTNQSEMAVQKRQSYHHSRQPSSRTEKKCKINDLQLAQSKLLTKINSLQNELVNYTQLCQQKKKEQSYSQQSQTSAQFQQLSLPQPQSPRMKMLQKEDYKFTSLHSGAMKNFINLHNPKQIFSMNDSLQIFKLSQSDMNFVMKILSCNQMRQLQYLNLENCKLTSSTFLSNFPQLLVIKMEHNQLNELTGLEQLQCVQEIYVGYNRIADLRSLRQQTFMKIMDFHNNLISSLTQLINLQKCKLASVVSFRGNLVAHQPEYRRILLKMFPTLRGTDIEETWSQSDNIKYMRVFYEKKIHHEELGNFSFSQDG